MSYENMKNRACIVPRCSNTSSNTSEKVFIAIPKNEHRRRLWFKAMGLYSSMPRTIRYFVCEDHFELENDMENFMRWRLTGGAKIMKKDVLPHKFDCRKNSSCTSVTKATNTKSSQTEDYNKKDVGVMVKPHFGSEQTQTPELNSSTLQYYAASQPSTTNQFKARSHTFGIINSNSWRYIGLRNECMFIIELIEQYSHLDTTSIFLTLQKIRLSQTFWELGDAYGMSESAASNTFLKTVPIICQLMKELIIWPEKTKIQELLPVTLKSRFGMVHHIIYCLEVEIQKPIDKVKQELTWSVSRRTNTLKYLVSSTSDGIVNFVSTGFGGRSSDALLVTKSGFLNFLQPGTFIIVAEGFENTEKLFTQKQCTLLRVRHANQKINVHIKQVMRQLQEFRILNQHSCVGCHLVPYMDFITVIACGLINL